MVINRQPPIVTVTSICVEIFLNQINSFTNIFNIECNELVALRRVAKLVRKNRTSNYKRKFLYKITG